jgi:hypothetical protein
MHAAKVFPTSAVNLIMTPAIAAYYSIAIIFAIAASLVIPLYLRSARRWSGAAVRADAADAATFVPVTQTVGAATLGPRLVAISGSVVKPTSRTRSFARQSLPNRVRAIENVALIVSDHANGLTPNLITRRPGLPKGSARCERRLAVVR